MKKLFLLTTLVLFSLASYCQAVMKIAGNDISKQEFEYYYNKNVSSDSTKMSIREYSDLFINFKLKVQEAYSRYMDTTTSFKNELNSYREQLITPYLVDSQKIKELVIEEYERLQEDVDVCHILFRIDRGGDTLSAYKKAQDALARLNNESFASVAASLSEDPSMEGDSGRIGWITGLTTVYPFESAAYNTPVGSHSGIVRTIFGYHIVKVNDRRPSRGEVKVAHIFIRKKEDMTPHQLDSIRASILKIQQDIKAGNISFADAALKYSEDGTAKSGGELPWIYTGKTNEMFEDAAFALQNKGDISDPLEVSYGWHIIKLIDKKPIDSIDEMTPVIESRIKGDERALIISSSFINKLMKKYNFKEVKNSNNGVLATFADVTLTKDSLKKFIDNNANIDTDTLKAFYYSTLFEYEKNNLEKNYPEFGLLMQEYKDGILMFNISQMEIWEKAARDTTGMRLYFEANREKYSWNTPHYKGIIVHCADKNVKKQAKKMLSSMEYSYNNAFDCLANLNIDGHKYVKIERGVYSEGKNQYIDYYVFKKGKLPENKKYPESFVIGNTIYAPETYNDTKGPVLNDYQSVIEAEWIKVLRAKYPVEIYPEALDTIK